MKEDTQYYNRETGKLEKESILGDRWLRLAYLSPIRGALQWPLFSHALFSRLMGWYLDRPSSVKRIAPTVRQLGINMDEVIIPEGGFTSFNDFFARELKPSARPLPQDPNLLISPADCRLTVYPLLTAGLVVPVKGTPHSMADRLGLQGSRYARAFDGGSLMVCRLCPADYHRYHFPDDGIVEDYWVTHGKYHSVHPIALQRGHRVFAENFRTARIMALRDKYDIPLQPLSVCGFSCSTDALGSTIQGRGIAGATLTIPRRYSHSPTELMHVNDAMAMLELLTRFVTE